MLGLFRAKPAQRPKPLVLHVDDDADLRALVSAALGRLPVEAIDAADGLTGVKMALKHLPNLILLDLMMPGVDGIDVCHQLRSNGKTSGIPIYMLTGRDQMKDLEKALAWGANGYITKPFSTDHFLHIVSKQLFPEKKP